MCPNFGTTKSNKFSIWNKWKIINFPFLEQMENLLFLGVPILKHIMVMQGEKQVCKTIPRNVLRLQDML